MREHQACLPHGSLDEIFGDVFVVTGTSRPRFMGQQFCYSRNMTVLRRGAELTLVNSVRLNQEGLGALQRLGKVAHVVRLGAYHGMDDPFYVDRFGAELWALPGTQLADGDVAHDLRVGGELPIDNAALFVFETTAVPEAIVHLQREGGILLSCDSLQNWAEPDQYFDAASVEAMRAMGFFREANVGPGWFAGAKPTPSDFRRLQELEYRHLLSAHGAPLLKQAKQKVQATLDMLRLSS